MATNLDDQEKNAVVSSDTDLKKTKKSTTRKKKTTTKKVSSKTKKTAKAKKVNSTTKKAKKVEKPEILDSAIIEKTEPKVVEKKKRTITHVRMPKNKKQTTEETKDIMKEPKKKRTLHLNMNFGKENNSVETVTPVDTSVNQNSSFFYEPSVFEKFNLTISDVDNDVQEESNETDENIVVEKEVTDESDILSSTTDYHTNSMKTFVENRLNDLFETESDSDIESADNFFDSSIPSMSNEVVKRKQRKLKSSISPIFKKFNFDETTIIQPITPEDDETPNNIIIPKEIKNTKVDGIEIPLDTSIPSIEITADSAAVATPVIDTNVVVSTEEADFDEEDILNISSQESTSPLSLDEDKVEELLANEANEDSKEIDYENSNSLDNLPEFEEDDDELEIEEYSFDENYNYDEKEDVPEKASEEYNDEAFSIESYFGLDRLSDDDFKELTNEDNTEENEDKIEIEDEIEEVLESSTNEFSTITKLLESFNTTINNLSDKISVLEERAANTAPLEEKAEPAANVNSLEENDEPEIEISDEDLLEYLENSEETNVEETSEEDSKDAIETQTEAESEDEEKLVEDILSEALLSEDSEIDEDLKNSLLSEVFEDSAKADTQETNNQESDEQIDSDFSKVLECLTNAINELESTQPAPQEVSETSVIPEVETENTDIATTTIDGGKSINILIDKDDIFSIQILNETYEIVADFDGISVLSENIHISTPKNNFYVKIGEKYIEIHNQKNQFAVYTNFEDVEFANAINNVGFAKKNNRIELNIKEAFKLASVNNRIELSMLNKTIASIKDTPVTQIDEGSICDNRTLLISEETQKVYLPYTIADVMNKLKYNDEFKSVQDVVDKEYTVPLSTFKMPIISRFKEAYRFMRTKENSSVYAAIDLAVELMFNSNLNPAVIRAAKDLKELNIYLDCLYENEVDKFDCFKIVYKVLPKIK